MTSTKDPAVPIMPPYRTIGSGGRDASEWVVAIDRNRRSRWSECANNAFTDPIVALTSLLAMACSFFAKVISTITRHAMAARRLRAFLQTFLYRTASWLNRRFYDGSVTFDQSHGPVAIHTSAHRRLGRTRVRLGSIKWKGQAAGVVL